MAKKKTKPELDPQAAVQALEYLFATVYIDKKRLYFENFMRGMFFSVGSVIGLAIVVTVILWILSWFDSIPFVNTVVENVQKSLNTH